MYDVIAEQHRLTNHTFDWDSFQCLTYSTNYFQRPTLESWFTNLEQTSFNRFQPLPAPYKRLTHDINITNVYDVIAEQHRLTNHTFDWDSFQCLTYSTNYFQRPTLESWFTNLEQTSFNRFQPLPAPYKRLTHDINITKEPNRTS